jgi:hypothetical protein
MVDFLLIVTSILRSPLESGGGAPHINAAADCRVRTSAEFGFIPLSDDVREGTDSRCRDQNTCRPWGQGDIAGNGQRQGALAAAPS